MSGVTSSLPLLHSPSWRAQGQLNFTLLLLKLPPKWSLRTYYQISIFI